VADEFERLRDALAGHYDVERVLGQGGMAVVYLARDLKHSRAVAIKVLKPELAATIGADRFLREIRVAAQLQHSGILGLYDSGAADGLLYYVMPFVEGESLRGRIDRERQLPIEDVTRLVREAAESLQYAHDRGIVHRDIKPENILLQRGHALVADFGIAKAVEVASAQKLTETGMALGTPHYMSPEQALGGELDGRSDQYSLGCVLYEALVGQPPFDGPNPMALLARHAMEQVPSVRVVRPSIPDQLEDVVMQALAKAPEDRFERIGDMADLLGQLESALALERTSGRRAAATPRTPMPAAMGISRTPRTPMPRATGARTPPMTAVAVADTAIEMHRTGRRVGAIAGVVAAALLLAGGWAWTHRAARAAPVVAGGLDPRRIAILYFDDTSPDHHLAPLADGLTEDLIRSLGTVQGLEIVSQNGVAAFRNPALPRDSVARQLRAGTLVMGQVEPGDKQTVRLTVRLVDGAGSEFKKVTVEEPAGDALAMRTALTARVSDLLRERLGEEVRTRAERSAAHSADAWVVLQRAEQQRKAAELAASAGEALEAGRHFMAADSLAVVAVAGDPAWNAPLVFRGRIAYRRSRLAVNNPLAADPYIAAGLALADTVLQRDPSDPDALELRGSLRYWRWLLRLESDKTAAQALLDGARADLEASTRLAPLQAGAWGSLSHLYYQTGNTSDVLLAARKAYEADAYLENAGTILDRLFTASYDLEQAVDASQWCAEGLRRFPDDARFQLCQLYLMTMPGQKPDVAKAWRIAGSDALRSDPSTGSPEFQVREARMVVAAILGRAGLGDSARTVIIGSRAGADIDPTKDLYHDEAFAQLQRGDKPAALAALKTYMAANPDAREGLAQDPGWWFRDLAGDAAFKAAVGAQ
jgi:eukaryotic-like serine/threonine-protein kinase